MQPTNAPEEWRSIPGYEGFYEASSHGRIKSLDRVIRGKTGTTRFHKGRILRLQTQRSGHAIVSLSRDGVVRQHSVHVLVLATFKGDGNGLITRHLDGDPANNHIDNLVWGTYSENNYDKVKHGVHHLANKVTCIRGHLLQEPNLVRAVAKQGRRKCRACSRGHAMCHTRKDHSAETMQMLSDWQYGRIMGVLQTKDAA